MNSPELFAEGFTVRKSDHSVLFGPFWNAKEAFLALDDYIQTGRQLGVSRSGYVMNDATASIVKPNVN